MSYRIIAALALSLGLSTAALAQTTDTTAGGTAGAGGEVMLPSDWQGPIADALFSDPAAGTLKSEEEIRSGWGNLSADQQAQIRSECDTHMAAAGTGTTTGTGTNTTTGAASTDTMAGADTSTDDDTTAGASTDTMASTDTSTDDDTTAGASTDTMASTDTDTSDELQTGATTGTDTTAGATTGAAGEPITIADADMTTLCTTVQGL